MRTRFIVATAILIVALSSLLLPSINSQEFSTKTTTTQSTLTETTMSPSYYYQTTTVGVTLTATVTYVLTAAHAGCRLGWFSFNVSRTGEMHIDYSTNQPSDFYVLTLWQWGLWAGLAPQFGSSPYCNPISDVHYHVDSSSSYDLNLNPADNPYFFIMVGGIGSQYPQIKLAMGPFDTGRSIAVTFTLTQLLPVTSTETSTYRRTLTTEIPFLLSSRGLPYVLVTIAIAIAVLFGALFLVYYHKSQKIRRTKRRK